VTQILNKSSNNREHRVLDLAFAALCVLALIKGIQTTGDLQWPYDLDQFRELGMAQSVLDHRYGTDHVYAGQTIWYNPLTSTLIATLSRTIGIPVSLVVTRAGAYLNLLAPIGFYILAAYLFDRWIALGASAAFLFGPIGDAPSWAAASYSPWLLSQNFAQGFFYFTLVSYAHALESTRWRWYLISGMLLGVTFLGHTAPAVLLGVIMLVASMKSVITQNRHGVASILGVRELQGLLIILSVAFIVSLPFTFSILFHYHLRILNPVPSNWIYAPLAVDKFPRFALSYFSWFSAFAVFGLVGMIVLRPYRNRKALLLTWLVVCCVALGLNEIQQLLSTNLHLMFVPAHHFLFYLKAIEDVFFAVGLVLVCRFVAGPVLTKLFDKTDVWSKGVYRWIERVLIGAGVVSFLVLVSPVYLNRFDFTTARDQAIGFQQRKAYIDAYQWILSNTKPDDVFLSLTGDLDLSIVGPADRKVAVVCQPEFSNPYVSWKSRADAAAKVVDKLADGAPDALNALIVNHLSYIITAPIDKFDHQSFPFLSKQFSEDDVIIYRVHNEAGL
jgi:hypothetical protein